MKNTVYILYSESLDRFYTGITSLVTHERLQNHIEKKYTGNKYTKKADDWVLYFQLDCSDTSQARKIELHIKKMKSATYIRNLKIYPEISEKLLIRYRSI